MIKPILASVEPLNGLIYATITTILDIWTDVIPISAYFTAKKSFIELYPGQFKISYSCHLLTFLMHFWHGHAMCKDVIKLPDVELKLLHNKLECSTPSNISNYPNLVH
jgi:cytochrome bd-type quinol oxidase subunit 1